ncbi:MAG: radical SAM protein [Nitrospiraceae bacterium]
MTKRCNLQCLDCRAIPRPCASPEESNTTEGLSFIDALAGMGRPLLVFTGGEPLLRDDLFVLARYAQRRSLPFALATNGTLVTSDIARRIVKTGFKRVSISLDGPDAETHDRFRRVSGAFGAAVDGFIHLKRLGMSMQVNTTVTVQNRERLEEIHELVRKLDADAWHLFLLVPVGCGLEISQSTRLAPRDYEEVLYWVDDLARRATTEVRATCAPHAQRIRLQRQAMYSLTVTSPPSGGSERGEEGLQTRRGCSAGTGTCFVSHSGEVFPCGYLPVSAGNVRKQSFASIWAEAPVFEELRDPDLLLGKCGVCEYRSVCGGCRARAFGRTGAYLYEEPFCNYLPALANGK